MKIQKLFSKWRTWRKIKKIKLREIDKELSKTSLQFGENVLAETKLSIASYG
jgi:Zn-dependent oligopeptidase